MKTQIDYQNLVKYFSYTVVGSSLGWGYYQIKKTKHILENAIDGSVLNVKLGPAPEDHPDDFIDVLPAYRYESLNFFRSTWDSIKFSFARRLVRLANSEDAEFRVKAVKHLAKIKNLNQWHCSLLANMIGPRTAVALARSGEADERLLMDPPLRYHNYNKDMLVNAMREFLIGLFERSQHACLGYFLSKVFVYEHDNFHIVDNDSSALELSKFIQSEQDVLPKCLESLTHHARMETYVRDMVDLNGLPLLMEIYQRYKNDININIKLCQILSYLSFNRSLLEPLHKSGWIGILSHWTRHEDVRISVPAARALANLDLDDKNVYSKHIYLLHPLFTTPKQQLVDVVFVHGLLGGVFYTWRQRTSKPESFKSFIQSSENLKNPFAKKPMNFLKDLKEQLENEDYCKEYEIVWDDIPVNTNSDATGPYTCPADTFKPPQKTFNKSTSRCWPKDWLARDCDNLRIIGINYDTSISMWASICPEVKIKYSLEERSNDLLNRLLEAGLGERPIVWVTHSMGGLIVKHILCRAFENENERVKKVCTNTKAIVFYSTPHNGSRIANLSQATTLLLWPSVEVQELKEGSPKLKRIHQKFLEIVKSVPINIITFVETKSTIVTAMKFNFMLVEPKSGNPGVGEYYEIPQDHLGICKPLSKYSFLYQKVLHLLQNLTKEAEEQNS